LSSIILQTIAIAPRDPDSGDPGGAPVSVDVVAALVPHAAITATDWADMIVYFLFDVDIQVDIRMMETFFFLSGNRLL
jgi:hypothetical protein